MQDIREFQYSCDLLIIFTTEFRVALFLTDIVSGGGKIWFYGPDELIADSLRAHSQVSPTEHVRLRLEAPNSHDMDFSCLK
jgi:hypothetical protein